jgi:hypothetical protein
MPKHTKTTPVAVDPAQNQLPLDPPTPQLDPPGPRLDPPTPKLDPPGPRLAFIHEQPGLPIRFDAKRGCDQVRARVYHDRRMDGPEQLLAIALSEFVNVHTFTAHPKQDRLADMLNTNHDPGEPGTPPPSGKKRHRNRPAPDLLQIHFPGHVARSLQGPAGGPPGATEMCVWRNSQKIEMCVWRTSQVNRVR